MCMAEREDVNARDRPAGIPKLNLHGFLFTFMSGESSKEKKKKENYAKSFCRKNRSHCITKTSVLV